MPVPNYAEYSDEELYDVLNIISKTKYPENYERLIAEIQKRKLIANQSKTISQSVETPKVEARAATPPPKEIALSAHEKKNCTLVSYILFFNAIIILSQFFFLPSPQISTLVTTAIIDIICGILLLANPSKTIITIVVARAGLGAIIYITKDFIAGDFAHLFLQLVYSASVILLLTAKLKIVFRNIAIGVTIAIQIYLFGLVSSSVLIQHNLDSIYALDDTPINEINGVFFEYQLYIESEDWYLRDRESALKENPLVDQWAVNPEYDAHVLIIGEKMNNYYNTDLSDLRDNVIKNAQSASSQFKKISEFAAKSEYTGLIIHSKATIDLHDLELLHGLYIVNDNAFQILTFCKTADYEKLESEFLEIINSFKYLEEITTSDEINL